MFVLNIGRALCLILCMYLISSCGYRFAGGESSSHRTTISVPYVAGDHEGKLTIELMRQLASSGTVQPVHHGGDLILKVAIVEDGESRIGFRFDREVTTGKRLSNLIGVENRRSLTVEASLLDVVSNQTIFGPEKISAHVDFDYVNSDSIRDLTFINRQGEREKVIRFSLGQLDSIEGAQDSAATPLFGELANKIVNAVLQKIN